MYEGGSALEPGRLTTAAGLEPWLPVLTDVVATFVDATGDLETLARCIAERVAQLLDVACQIYVLGEDGTGWQQRAFAGNAVAANAAPISRDDAAVRQALDSGQPVFSAAAATLDQAPVESAPSPPWVYVPLRSRGRSFGLLALARTDRDPLPLSATEILLGRYLAQAAAVALEYSGTLLRADRQLAERQRMADRLQLLAQASRDFSAASAEIEQANRLKSEFLANMSHELRTPLNAIIGFSSLLHAGRVGALTETQVEYLGDILVSSRHLLRLINDVLDLAKVEAGRIELQPEPVDLRRVSLEVKDILRGLAAEKHVELSFHVDPELSDVVADARLLKQILYSYLSNAVKFTSEHGTVLASISAGPNDTFDIRVEDHGIGIRPEDLQRLFVEFQQLDSSTAKTYPGTGLGLALTKRIVEAQGGSVSVSSVAGKGSVFGARLPRKLRLP